MKCIRHPANEPMNIYRQWQLKACDGNISSAIMLSFFEYWHNIKLEQRQQASKYNQIANKHGEDGGQLETLIQWHTNEDIENHTGLKRHSINKAIASLVELGFISTCRNPNPRFSFDTTKHFKFNADVVNHWIENYNTQNKKNICPSAENCNRDAEFDRSPVEICNGPVEICNGPVEICKYPKIPIQDSSIENKQEKDDAQNEQPDRSLSFFSESEPEPEQPSEPTKNPPLLAEVEIKSEDKPTSSFQVQEKNQGVSVESENKAPQPPAYYIPSPEQNGKSIVRFPSPGDINSAAYCQELKMIPLTLPDEFATATKMAINKPDGRHLLCLLKEEGIDPIAHLPKFLKFYYDENLAESPSYKGKPYNDMAKTKTVKAIASKIRADETEVLIQTITDFKKKITKPVETAPQINFSDPIPEGDRYTLPKIDNLFEEQKKRIKQQQTRNKPKMTSLSKNEVSIALESVTASNANLSPNPETFESEYDF